MGGCRGYQSGMYYRMIFCRSYGGNYRSIPCAIWANPSHSGYYSGEIGTDNNVGGNCCQNITFVPSIL